MNSRDRTKAAFAELNCPVYEGRNSGLEKMCKNEKQLIVLFLGSNLDLAKAAAFMKQLKNQGRAYSFIFSAAAQEILSVSEWQKKYRPKEVVLDEPLHRLKDLVASAEAVYVPNLTLNTAAKTALGIGDEFSSYFLWTCLAAGISVHLDTASVYGTWGKGNGKSPMEKTAKSHLDVLKSYGAKLDQLELLVTELNLSAGEALALSTGRKNGGRKDGLVRLEDDLSKRVITEGHIMKVDQGSKLAVSRGVRVTPLAQETARKRKIEIVLEE